MLEDLKKRVCTLNKRLPSSGLVILTWGNVSARDPKTGLVVIKPSGVAFDSLQPADMVVVDLDGKVIEGNLMPSTDTPTHLEIYKAYPQINGIVHTHSTYAVAWAQAQKPIPCLGTTHADSFKGEIRITDFLPPKAYSDYEKKTGEAIVSAFKEFDPLDCPAVLVRSHGPFTFGRTPEAALENSLILEKVAQMAFISETLCQDNVPAVSKDLLKKHYERKHGESAYYGQRKLPK
jgi:L-ribulose-5-phosphate 4-epimerase